VMKLDKQFVVMSELNDETVTHEMYDMEIYAASQEMADKAGKALCDALGLTLHVVIEKDWK